MGLLYGLGDTGCRKTRRSFKGINVISYKRSYLRYLAHDLIDVKSGVYLDTDASVVSGYTEHELAGLEAEGLIVCKDKLSVLPLFKTLRSYVGPEIKNPGWCFHD